MKTQDIKIGDRNYRLYIDKALSTKTLVPWEVIRRSDHFADTAGSVYVLTGGYEAGKLRLVNIANGELWRPTLVSVKDPFDVSAEEWCELTCGRESELRKVQVEIKILNGGRANG